MIDELKKYGIVKYGNFVLKNGETSDYYVDFRESLGYPKLFKKLGVQLSLVAQKLDFDLVCGVPYGAVPLATSIALELEVPLLLCRKEAKTYGQKKCVEGIFSPGQKCLLVEDVVTTGSSIIGTAQLLRHEGLQIHDCISILCRNKSAEENLQHDNIQLHSLLSL